MGQGQYSAADLAAPSPAPAQTGQYSAADLAPDTQQPEQPGFFKRFAQAVGIPTSTEDAQNALKGMSGAGYIYNMDKNAIQAAKNAYKEGYEAAGNIKEGGPVLPNLGKAATGVLEGMAATTPSGATLMSMGSDIKDKNYAGAAGSAAGVVTNAAAMAAGGGKPAEGGISQLRSPLGDMVDKPRGPIAPEAYTPRQLMDYAKANGIDINAAQATEHNLPRNIQSAGERATVGGTAVRQQVQAAQAQLGDHVTRIMDTLSPNTPDPASAGAAVKQSVQNALEQQQAASRQEYAAIDQAANGTMVNLAPVKQAAQKILADSNFLRDKVPSLDQKRASGILAGIANAPDNATFSQAQELRSALLDESRSPDLAISQRAQAWLKQITGSVDGQMMDAAQSVPGLGDKFRDANSHWKQLQDDFNNPRSPLAQVLNEPDPSRIAQLLTQKGQTGGSPYRVGLLDKYGIDKGPVQRMVVQDMYDRDFGLFKNKSVAGYSNDFLGDLFTPTQLDAIYKTGAIARSVSKNANPSGTAVVEGAMADVQKPVRSMLPKSLAAKATTDPGFNAWLMNPKNPPSYAAYLRARQLGGVAAVASESSNDQR